MYRRWFERWSPIQPVISFTVNGYGTSDLAAGAADEIVKLWDLRKLTHPCAELTPKKLRGNQQHPALVMQTLLQRLPRRSASASCWKLCSTTHCFCDAVELSGGMHCVSDETPRRHQPGFGPHR